jgi:uncharacterized membrane protein
MKAGKPMKQSQSKAKTKAKPSNRRVAAYTLFIIGALLVCIAVRESMVVAMLGLFLVLVAAIDQYASQLKFWQQSLVLGGFMIIGYIPISVVNNYNYYLRHACVARHDCVGVHQFTPLEQIDRHAFGESDQPIR